MKRFSLLPLFCAVALSAAAQQPLTIDQCKDLALAHNKQLRVSKVQTAQQHYTVQSLRATFLPHLTANGVGYYTNSAGTLALMPGVALDYKLGAVYHAALQVEQPLYMGGKLTAALHMAEVGYGVAQTYERLTEQQVVLATCQAFAQVVKAQAMCLVAAQYMEVATELKRNVESGYRLGATYHHDLLRMEVRMGEAALMQQRAANALRLATMNLCHYIGKPLTTSLQVDNSYPLFAADEVEMAYAERPEYAIAAAQVEMARQGVKLARSEQLPHVGLVGTYGYTHGITIAGMDLLHSTACSALVSVNIPLYHFGANANRVRAAKAKLVEAQIAQSDAIDAMTLEWCQALIHLQEAASEVTLTEQTLTHTAEHMRLTQLQYGAGTATLATLLEAQLLWQQAYQQLVEARFNHYMCHLSYLKTCGKL